MRNTLLLFVVLLAALVSWRLFVVDAGPAAPPQATKGEGAQDVPVDPAAAAGGALAIGEARQGGDAAAGEEQRTAVSTSEGASALAMVTGRFVDANAAPRAGLEVSWRSWRDSGSFGIAHDWPSMDSGPKKEGTVRTDSDGRFRFAMAHGRAGDIEIDVAQFVLEQGKGRFSTKNGDHDFGDVRVLVPSRVAGVVVDEAGKPIEGVRVGVDASGFGLGLRSETKTDAAGAFVVGGLNAGGWKLRTLSPSYMPATLDIALADEEQKSEVMLRLARGNAISGQVVDDRGMPVVGAKVGCMRNEQLAGLQIQRFADEESTTTDDRGWFTIAGLEGDTATVRSTHKGHEAADLEAVRIGSGNVVLRMQRLATITGTLRDATGKPIAGSRVTARRAQAAVASPAPAALDDGETEGFSLAHLADVAEIDTGEEMPIGIDADHGSRARHGLAVTAEDGAFVIEGVRPGAVVVRAHGKHRPVERTGLQIAPAQKLDSVALVADVGSTALVAVVDEMGKPVRDAKVVLEAPPRTPQGGNVMSFSRGVRIGDDGDRNFVSFGDDAKVLGRGVTGEDGIARIHGLAAGAAIARCTHSDFAPSRTSEISLPAQGEAKADLVLRTPGVARLLVTDAGGMPIAADFVVRGPLGVDEPASTRDGASGSDGIARVQPLARGRYAATLRTSQKAKAMGGLSIVMAGAGGRSLSQSRVEFEVTGGNEVDVALRMPTLATVRGVVSGTKGPAADVEVELAPTAGQERQSGMPRDGIDVGELDLPGFSQQSDKTESSGAYGIDEVVPGRYSLSWGLVGQAVKDSMEITIADGEVDVVRDLRLRHGSIRVVVTGDGEPLEGAEIEVLVAGKEGQQPPQRTRMVMVSMTVNDDGAGSSSSLTMGAQSVRTDVDGEAVVENVPPGRYVVRIKHSRYSKRELATQDVLENAQTDCGRVQLDAAGRIRGRVVSQDGKPVKMALVTCRRVGDVTGEPERKPTMNGAFTLSGLAAGRYELTARALSGEGDADGDPVTVEVQAGKTAADVEVRLPPQ